MTKYEKLSVTQYVTFHTADTPGPYLDIITEQQL